ITGVEHLITHFPTRRSSDLVKYGKKFISLPKGQDPLDTTLNQAIELIEERERADAPIATYDSKPVQKGVGRFDPYIKWNNIFIKDRKSTRLNSSHVKISYAV